MNKISAIIIEDEQHNVRELTRALSRIDSEIDILDQASSGEQALSMISLHQPDLIFLDVELGDMDGFDLLEELQTKLDSIPAVIFVTGHDGFAVRAFRHAAVDYLMKPILDEELKEAIEKVMSHSPMKLREQVYEISAGINRLQIATQTFGISSRKGIHFIKLQDIVRVNADTNRSDLYLANASPITYINYSIKQLQEMLGPFGFLRVSQSDMINVAHLKTVEEHTISLQHHERPVPISKRYRKEVMAQLRGLVLG